MFVPETQTVQQPSGLVAQEHDDRPKRSFLQTPLSSASGFPSATREIDDNSGLKGPATSMIAMPSNATASPSLLDVASAITPLHLPSPMSTFAIGKKTTIRASASGTPYDQEQTPSGSARAAYREKMRDHLSTPHPRGSMLLDRSAPPEQLRVTQEAFHQLTGSIQLMHASIEGYCRQTVAQERTTRETLQEQIQLASEQQLTQWRTSWTEWQAAAQPTLLQEQKESTKSDECKAMIETMLHAMRQQQETEMQRIQSTLTEMNATLSDLISSNTAAQAAVASQRAETTVASDKVQAHVTSLTSAVDHCTSQLTMMAQQATAHQHQMVATSSDVMQSSDLHARHMKLLYRCLRPLQQLGALTSRAQEDAVSLPSQKVRSDQARRRRHHHHHHHRPGHDHRQRQHDAHRKSRRSHQPPISTTSSSTINATDSRTSSRVLTSSPTARVQKIQSPGFPVADVLDIKSSLGVISQNIDQTMPIVLSTPLDEMHRRRTTVSPELDVFA